MRHNQSMGPEYKRDICAFKGLIIHRQHTPSSLLLVLEAKDRYYKMCYQFPCGTVSCSRPWGTEA